MLTLLSVFVAGLVIALAAPKLAMVASPLPSEWDRLWHALRWICEEVLPKVGDALLVAPILALVVDNAAKQNLLSDFARDVSVHIIGRYLPRELREHIHGYLTVDIVRLDLDIVYTITELENGKGVKLETTMTSDLHNYSNKEIKTDIFVAVSKSLDPQIGNTVLMEVTAGDFTYRHGDTLEGLNNDGSDEVYRTTLKLAPAHPVTLPHGTRCIVKSNEYFTFNDQNAFLAVYPVIGATVTVIQPGNYETILDLTFTTDNMEPLTRDTAPRRCRWKINSPILQGQGFFLRWKRLPGENHD